MEYKAMRDVFLEEFELQWKTLFPSGKKRQSLQGNRFRPLMVYWAFSSFGHKAIPNDAAFENLIKIACAIELTHKASILLDDWIDDDATRHGEATFHSVYGAEYTVSFALKMLLKALRILYSIHDDDSEATSELGRASIDRLIVVMEDMVEGQLSELELDSQTRYDKEIVAKVIEKETSAIISESLNLGYLAGCTMHEDIRIAQLFREIGIQSGFIFQTLNDFEPFSESEAFRTHKKSCNYDYNLKRKNIAVAFLSNTANCRDRKRIESGTCSLAELRHLMKKYKIKSTVEKEIEFAHRGLEVRICEIDSRGASSGWKDSFLDFMESLMAYAKSRLTEG